MAATSTPVRMRADRRDFLAYRVKCPRCGTLIGPRDAIRELMDVPPDPPYAAIVRCPRCNTIVAVDFDAQDDASA